MNASDGPGTMVEVLFSAAELRGRVAELAEQLSERFREAPRPPVFIGVLKGSTMFLADLIRACSVDVAVDFMSISSYRETSAQSGIVRIVKDLDEDIAGRDVVIIEDVVDTGLTLAYLRRSLLQRRPASLTSVTLLDRAVRRIVPVPLEYAGFEIPDVFVIGYGLDFLGRYRNSSELFAVTDLPRLANDPDALAPTFSGNSRPGASA